MSSICSSKFREAQAAALNEIQYNGKYLFNNMSKAALLLQYDLWFSWLLHVERTLVRLDDTEHVCQATMKAFLTSAELLETHSYDHILKREDKIFSKEFLAGHFSVRKFSFDMFRDSILEILGQTIGNTMYSLTDALMRMMRNSLYELQELDFILFNKDRKEIPFLSIQDWDLEILLDTDNCVVLKRGVLFSENYGVTKVNLKNYTLDDQPELDLLVSKLKSSNIAVEKVL